MDKWMAATLSEPNAPPQHDIHSANHHHVVLHQGSCILMHTECVNQCWNIFIKCLAENYEFHLQTFYIRMSVSSASFRGYSWIFKAGERSRWHAVQADGRWGPEIICQGGSQFGVRMRKGAGSQGELAWIVSECCYVRSSMCTSPEVCVCVHVFEGWVCGSVCVRSGWGLAVRHGVWCS